MRTFRNVVRVACALAVLYGVVDGYIAFEQRYDKRFVESSAHQIFVVIEAVSRVIFPYYLARGILIVMECERG